MYSIEIVKSHGAEIISDEVFGMASCPGCGRDVSLGWSYCPSCGAGPFEETDDIATCVNESDEPSIFKCSACGRIYVPVQIMKEGQAVEWNACPGCAARVLWG